MTEETNELLKQRVRVLLDFDVIVRDEKILHCGNAPEVKELDLALLQAFLKTDMLSEMLMYQIALELGMQSPEDFEEQICGKLMEGHYEKRLFGPAIESLEGDVGTYWREVRDLPPTKGFGDTLSLCTEQLFHCFSAHYVDSKVEIVSEQKEENRND